MFSYLRRCENSRYQGPEYRPSQPALAQHAGGLCRATREHTPLERHVLGQTACDKAVVTVRPL